MYGPKIEPYKRAYHYAIVFNDFGPFNELFDDETTEKIKKSVEGITDLKERRIKFSHALGDYILSLERCEHLERKEKFDLKNDVIEVFNKDYADVELPSPEDCVIYCDIPYDKTASYTTGSFDYERFYKWCQEKTSEGYQIYVSSYELPEDLFVPVWEKGRHSKALSGSKHVVEKIYTIRK
jgi:site-specific DNA-adenine methylase